MNTKKYFVLSDIHSFYNEMKSALWKAGFRKTNPDHYLIVCGDIFDRGPGTMQVYNFLRSIPHHRRIIIKGNHEYLYEDLLLKNFPESYDFSNGTVKTFCHIAGYSEEESVKIIDRLKNRYSRYYEENELPSYAIWNNIVDKVIDSPVTKWLKSKEFNKHYYELGKYIFVHSFIPTKLKKEYEQYKDFPAFYPDYPVEYCEYNPNWRNEPYWFGAVWGCPWLQYQYGFLKPENDAGKVLVCGHWSSYDFRVHLDNVQYDKDESIENIDFGIYYSKDIIALDACTVVSGQCNVLVLDDAQE